MRNKEQKENYALDNELMYLCTYMYMRIFANIEVHVGDANLQRKRDKIARLIKCIVCSIWSIGGAANKPNSSSILYSTVCTS